jgi:hypothetical protein
MTNTADVTGGKPIVVLLQFISDVSAINPLVAFYDIHGRKREVLYCYRKQGNDAAMNGLKHKSLTHQNTRKLYI